MLKLFEEVSEELARRIVVRYGHQVQAVVLFGSAARGEARWSEDVDKRSDIDVLVVTDVERQIERTVLRLQVDLDLVHHTVTNIVYRSLAEIEDHYLRGDPFIEVILHEGKVLYDTGAYRQLCERLIGQSTAVA